MTDRFPGSRVTILYHYEGAHEMNSVNLIGNLTKDPELRDGAGTPVVTLRLAVNGRRKSGEEWVDAPNFFDVTIWGRQAELAAEHLSRGRQVAVSGRLEWREWEADDGTKRQNVQVVAQDLDYLAKPQPRDEAPHPADPLASDEDIAAVARQVDAA